MHAAAIQLLDAREPGQRVFDARCQQQLARAVLASITRAHAEGTASWCDLRDARSEQRDVAIPREAVARDFAESCGWNSVTRQVAVKLARMCVARPAVVADEYPPTATAEHQRGA
jgi:hypothetical protein